MIGLIKASINAFGAAVTMSAVAPCDQIPASKTIHKAMKEPKRLSSQPKKTANEIRRLLDFFLKKKKTNATPGASVAIETNVAGIAPIFAL